MCDAWGKKQVRLKENTTSSLLPLPTLLEEDNRMKASGQKSTASYHYLAFADEAGEQRGCWGGNKTVLVSV
jgi:hypothetical protein